MALGFTHPPGIFLGGKAQPVRKADLTHKLCLEAGMQRLCMGIKLIISSNNTKKYTKGNTHDYSHIKEVHVT
jgi:hypothetical protein